MTELEQLYGIIEAVSNNFSGYFFSNHNCGSNYSLEQNMLINLLQYSLQKKLINICLSGNECGKLHDMQKALEKFKMPSLSVADVCDYAPPEWDDDVSYSEYTEAYDSLCIFSSLWYLEYSDNWDYSIASNCLNMYSIADYIDGYKGEVPEEFFSSDFLDDDEFAEDLVNRRLFNLKEPVFETLQDVLKCAFKDWMAPEEMDAGVEMAKKFFIPSDSNENYLSYFVFRSKYYYDLMTFIESESAVFNEEAKKYVSLLKGIVSEILRCPFVYYLSDGRGTFSIKEKGCWSYFYTTVGEYYGSCVNAYHISPLFTACLMYVDALTKYLDENYGFLSRGK